MNVSIKSCSSKKVRQTINKRFPTVFPLPKFRPIQAAQNYPMQSSLYFVFFTNNWSKKQRTTITQNFQFIFFDLMSLDELHLRCVDRKLKMVLWSILYTINYWFIDLVSIWNDYNAQWSHAQLIIKHLKVLKLLKWTPGVQKAPEWALKYHEMILKSHI